MSLTDGNDGSMVMPVAPMYGGGNNGGFGFGGDWGWIILLLLVAGNGWGGFGGGASGGYDFPWLLTGQQNINTNTNNGFRDAMINDGINGIRDGITGLSTQLCNASNGVQMALANGFAGVEQGANSRQMASMNQLFGLSQQFADCCCENRLATCQTQNIVQTEAAANRYADATNTRDIIENANRNNQAILDKLCQLELDAKNDKIADLERQLTMANMQASQTAQNAFIAQGLNDEVDALYNRLSNCPVPTTPVYGRTPIFTCANNGCGCGM